MVFSVITHISSGYRSPALNAAIGGSVTSAHCYGYAFNLVPLNRIMLQFKHFCREYLTHHIFDQLISERGNEAGLPNWMHVGYKSTHEEQHRQFLPMKSGKYYPMTK